jgi:radical SAM protein with 4Fe4S-binding SPASM domain
VTCSIWKIEGAGENDLSIEEIDKFSRSKYFRNVEYITLSGGEPTLRSDLPEVVSTLHKNIPTATFGITTHGMNPKLEEDIFKKIMKDNPNIQFRMVGLSLNGPPEVHDMTRGIKGSWQKTVETYERLKDVVHCEFSFTFCKDNVDYFDWIQEFARKKGTKAYICWTVMNERFNITDKDLVFWRPGMGMALEKYLKSRFPVPKNISGKIRNMIFLPMYINSCYMFDNVINRRNMPCYAGSQIVHIDPEANVYPCNFKLSEDRIVGNLRQNNFDEIWGNMPQRVLDEIANCECMYPNGLCGDSEIMPSIVNSPPTVLKWYIAKLLKGKPLIEEPKDEG